MLPLSPLLPVLVALLSPPQRDFVHFETPHVHPLERTPDGNRLLAVNTADARLEVFDLVGGHPVLRRSVPVGIDPVSVRARTNTEAWVVNHVSDSVSIVDLERGLVMGTFRTDDEPCDLVFAGSPQRAYVSCSTVNRILIMDPQRMFLEPVRLELRGEEPRALAVSPDGLTVYAAFFESGNGTTVLAGGHLRNEPLFPPNVVSDPAGPYAGVNPPPNRVGAFEPALDETLPMPPVVSHIVRQAPDGSWRDDRGEDWTSFVSGDEAARSGRPVGWTLLDNDLAVIDTATRGVRYVERLMTLGMALGTNPSNGAVTLVGTEALNEVRFEPVLNGVFLRVLAATFDPASRQPTGPTDLNGHLDYQSPQVPLAQRRLGIGDPRAVQWDTDGSRAWVAGMGSNNLVLLGPDGTRQGRTTIPVGEGPTGLALSLDGERLYVLNKFEASISVVDTTAASELERVPFFDPSPEAIKRGRKHLYDTHATSGTGIVSCASCHVDARTDRLSWDLGNPAGAMKAVVNQNTMLGVAEAWHPMKGPMTTQTLQDIIGKEPFHWRGDKAGLEEFNGAFTGLMGAEAQLDEDQMQEFEDFLATIHFQPNPFRPLDNRLPDSLPLPGHHATGAFELPLGAPLPPGNAQRGLDLYRPASLSPFSCVTCHTLPTGLGTDAFFLLGAFQEIPPGMDGEHHHALVAVDGFSNVTMKVPHLRNMAEKVGFETTTRESLAGFGFFHDGSIDSLSRFASQSFIGLSSDQQVADMVAFLLSFGGSDLPEAPLANVNAPPGPPSLDAHAAVGQQVTLRGTTTDVFELDRLAEFLNLADAGVVGMVAHGVRNGLPRGFYYIGQNRYQADRGHETLSHGELGFGAGPGREVTWTLVPRGTEVRMGVDRDSDGVLDRDELDVGSDPADPFSVPCAETPIAASDLRVPVLTTRDLVLHWTDAPNEEQFLVQRKSLLTAPFTTLATVPAGTTSFTDGTIECGTEYAYRIVAQNCGGSAFSSVLRVVIPDCDKQARVPRLPR